MKIIEVDDELYQFIASKTERIGEEASDILRRLLGFEPLQGSSITPEAESVEQPIAVEEAQTAPAQKLPTSLDKLALSEVELQHSVVSRFLYLLNALHSANSEHFDDIVKIRGRDRLYFAKSEEELIESGSSTNPKEIGQTGYWVLTNSNSTRKKWMLSEVAKMLGYIESDVFQLTELLYQEPQK